MTNGYTEFCSVRYEYKEVEDGVFNYAKLLLSDDMLTSIKLGLVKDVPIATLVSMLWDMTNKTQLTDQTVINAYLYYCSLLKTDYDFTCHLCGYFPLVDLFDLCKTTSFNLSVSEIDENKLNTSDYTKIVGKDEFW